MKVQESSPAYEVLAQSVSTDNWTLVPLKELGRWSGGGTPSKSKLDYWEGGTIPWVSPKDMKTDHIVDSEDHITKAAVEESTAKLISAGSVLIVTRSGILSHTLPVAVTTVPVTVNQDLKTLTPREGVLPEYVAWALRCFAREILNTCSKQGTTVSSIETAALHRFEIPVAPLDQQKRIVAEIEKQFSRLDEAVANLKRVKANLKRYKAAALKAAVEGMFTEAWRKQQPDTEPAGELLQRILTERRAKWEQAELVKMQAKGNAPKDDAWKRKYPEPGAPEITGLPKLPEGWVWASLEQLTTQIADVDHKMPKAFEGGIPYISTKDFKGENEIDFAGAKRISSVDYDALCRKVRPEIGDILLSRYGTVGEVRSVKTEMSFQASYSVAILKPINSFGTADFVATALRSDVIQSQIKRDIRGVAQPDLGLTHIRQFVIPFPSLEEQKQIIAEAERHLSLTVVAEAQVNANLLRANHLRQSILERVFSGQLLL